MKFSHEKYNIMYKYTCDLWLIPTHFRSLWHISSMNPNLSIQTDISSVSLVPRPGRIQLHFVTIYHTVPDEVIGSLIVPSLITFAVHLSR
jgi:hypothetical protein